MHVFIAMLSTETNTFSPVPTAYADYADFYLRRGTATLDPPNLMTEALHVWRSRTEAMGGRVTESLSAIAEPAGLTTANTYARLRGMILDDLRAAGPVDIILLQLHGAMIAEGCDDCEADLTAAVRAICPDAVIGVALDCHCHMRPALMDAADLLICFKEYPHDDATPRAEEIFDLAIRTWRGEAAPQMALFDCRMIALFLTKAGAMQDVVAQLHAAEAAPGILSVSFCHGFPWGDVPDTSARVLVTADGDAGLAQEVADRLGQMIYDRRADLVPAYPDLDAGLDQAVAAPRRPAVLADMSDNPGAGAPGDSTYVLRAVLDRGLTDVALGMIFDPMAVRACVGAGVGATLQLRIGGKTEPCSGQPLDVTGEVMQIVHNAGQHLGAGLEPMGTLIWLRLPGEVDVLLNDLRTPVYHPEAFTQAGITLKNKAIIAVKSLFHFYGPFAQISDTIIFCATPGRVNPDTAQIDFARRPLDYWPRHPNPLGR